jgi:hypothetical protein
LPRSARLTLSYKNGARRLEKLRNSVRRCEESVVRSEGPAPMAEQCVGDQGRLHQAGMELVALQAGH